MSAVRGFAVELMGKLFGGITPGQFVRRGLRVQCETTRDVILPELGRLDAGHMLKPYAPELDASVNGALAALDARARAKGARQVVANEIEEWKEGVNALRVTTYAELLKIAATRKYPKSWAESFFRQVSSASSDAENEATAGKVAAEPA